MAEKLITYRQLEKITKGLWAKVKDTSGGGTNPFGNGLVLKTREIKSSGSYYLNKDDTWIIFNSTSGNPRLYLGPSTEGRTIFVKNISTQWAFVHPYNGTKLFNDSTSDSKIEVQDGDMVVLTYKVLPSGAKAWVSGKFRY